MAGGVKISWWQWLPVWSWRLVELVESANEVSERLPRNGVTLVGTATMPKWIAFDCPCRTGHRIMINADTHRRPFWRLTTDQRGRVTISPSVDYSDQSRRCHYFVRNGKILWAKDTNR
jgi:hypothetical protein